MNFNLEKLFCDVFAPKRGEVVTILTDIPYGELKSTSEWQARFAMATRWHGAISGFADKLGTQVNPLGTYWATGAHGNPLPDKCLLGKKYLDTKEILKESDIVIAMTQFSGTGFLAQLANELEFRVASMPTVAPSMEQTALSADHAEIQRKCAYLQKLFVKAKTAHVEFSTEHSCIFDLASDDARVDDGALHVVGSFGNLPCGETYMVPNEMPGSLTSGQLPFYDLNNDLIIATVRENKIVGLNGENCDLDAKRAYFLRPGYDNVAEFAIGVNTHANPNGNILENEKFDFHWAHGRSDYMGGIITTESFGDTKPVHQDFVYSKVFGLYVKKLTLVYADNTEQVLIEDSKHIYVAE